MNKKSEILLIGSGGTVRYLGENWYPALKKDMTFAVRPHGKLAKEDVFVYFSQEAENIAEVMALAGCRSAGAEAAVIAGCFSDDISPICKLFESREQARRCRVLLETVYRRNELKISLAKDRIFFEVNGQCLSRDTGDISELAVILRDGEPVFFTSGREDVPFCALLSGRGFEAYADPCVIQGAAAERILDAKLLKKLGAMGDGCCENLSFANSQVRVSKTVFETGTQAETCYTLSYERDLVDGMIRTNTEYDCLTKDSAAASDPRAEMHLSGFRLWGGGGKLKELELLLQKCSVTNSTVMLTGESGTGKTVLARGIHAASRRSGKPFVHINCAAIPYQLMESELFGYESGAFTGARSGGKQGLFEAAYGGTLFLDEIAEIPPALQGKLLEVLQSRSFYRVGGTEKKEVDFRLIAATNKNLRQAVKERTFREDLFYRINVFPIELPPLRDRLDALGIIVAEILPDICSRIDIEPVRVSWQALEKMKAYSWPGNIRELENVLEKAAILCDSRLILPEDVILSDGEGGSGSATLKDVRESAEKAAITRALEMFSGDKLKAAAYLDISRTAIFDKIRRYGLDEAGRDHDIG